MLVAEDEVLQIVSSCFQRALLVGFQRDVIRLQVQSILTSFPNITDNGLLKKVNAIMAMDKENREKTGKSAAVNLLNVWHGEIPHFPTKRTETDKGVRSEAATNDRVKCGSRSCDQGFGGENTANDLVRNFSDSVVQPVVKDGYSGGVLYTDGLSARRDRPSSRVIDDRGAAENNTLILSESLGERA